MINKNALQKYKPVQGLVVYKRQAGEFYLQTHNIEEVNSKYQWGEGKPFSKDKFADLASALGKQSLSLLQLKGIMPSNVLYYQPSFLGDKYMWFLPPTKKRLLFSEDTNIESGEVKLPGLIFAVNDKTIYVFAYKGTNRPDDKTTLYRGPFFNINGDDDVCMGNTAESKKKHFLEDELVRWERRFFQSRFTHVNNNPLKRGYNISVVYKDLLAGGEFPEDCLTVSNHKTVAGFLKKLINEKESDY